MRICSMLPRPQVIPRQVNSLIYSIYMEIDLANFTQAQELNQLAANRLKEGNFGKAEQLADRLFELKQYLDAIRIYQGIIEGSPMLDCDIEGLGNSEEQIGYYEWDAFAWYREQRARKSIKGSPYDGLSLCCTANGKHEAGIAWYKEMVGKHPEDYRLVFGYANILYNNSIYEEAISNYELAFKLRPTFVKPLVDLALLYEYRRIHKRKSTQKSREILELEPNNQYALFILARNENDIDKKILQLQQTWKINPRYTRVCNEVGICYGGVKKVYEEAIRWYLRCTEINPKYSSCYNNIGVNYELLKKYEEAEKWYFRAVEADTEYKTAYKNLTDVFDELKFSDEQIVEESRKYKVNESIFCYYLGLSYYDKSKEEKSIKWIERAIELNGKDHRFYNSVAISYDEIKNYDKAIENYKKCIEIQPSYYSAYYNLAIVYKSQDNEPEAIKWYLKATEKNPRYSYAYNNLGNIYKKNEDYLEAIHYYEKAIEFNSTYTLAFINLGVCYLKVEQYKEASKAFEKAQEIVNTDNNNLSESNKEFIRPHLQKFELEGYKWMKFGTITQQTKEILNSLARQFEESFDQNEVQLQLPPASLKTKQLAETLRLIADSKFQLGRFGDVLLNVQRLYPIDSNYIYLLSEYAFQNFWKKKFEEKWEIEDIEIEIENALNIGIETLIPHLQLDPQIADNEALVREQLKKYEKAEALLDDENRFNLFEQVAYFTHYDRIFSQILKVHRKIEAEVEKFTNFLLSVKMKVNPKAFSKVSLRIPKEESQQHAAVLSIFEELFKWELGDGIKSQITATINHNLTDLKNISPKDVALELSKTWTNELTNIFLRERIDKNQETYCYVTDFAVGLCLFSSLKQIVAAVALVHENSKEYGFQVIQFSNQLFEKGKNCVEIVLKSNGAVFSLRFELESTHESVNFFREIRKIEHSPFGVIFGCLLAQSKAKHYSTHAICEYMMRNQHKYKSEQQRQLVELAQQLSNTFPSRKQLCMI